MSDVFKWTLATILHYALITSPMLLAQDTPPVKNASAQQPEARVPDDLKDGASPFGGVGVRDSSSNADLPASNVPAPTVTVDEEQLKIFHLQHSDANQTAAVIEQLFGGAIVTVAVDVRTNSLIVRSNEPLLQQIEAILLRLDEQPGKQAPIASLTTGTDANSTITIMPDPTSTSEPPIVPIAEYRRRLNELELPLLQLAEKVRSVEASLGKDHPESLKQRADLRALVQQTFAARQEIQRAELAEFTRRLQRMQQSIDARDRIADKIVDRRLEEFLNPEADWNLPLSARLEDSKSKVVLSEAKAATKYVRLPTHLLGTWAVEELSIKSAGIDISTINPKPRLTVTAGHLVVPMDGGITITMQYELIEGDPLRANLTFDGSHARTFGIIKYSNDSLWLCFREPADKGEPALTESNRPIDFLPGDKYYCIKCRKSSPVSETKAGPSTQLEPRIEPDSGTSVSELIPEPAFTSEENDTPFAITRWRPKSEAEKAIGRLVLVFFEDKARRAVPALLIQHGQETIALTAGPATIVPGNIEHAIDRTFLEFYDRENVPTTYADFSTPDLALHIAKEQLNSFRLDNPVTLKTDDRLSAILMHGQADFEVTADAARITAVDQKTTWQLPSHNLNREFTGLIQIDKRLPEGTPLFKDGELAGITLLGTRFMKDDVPGSYVVPASRIVEVLQQLKIE